MKVVDKLSCFSTYQGEGVLVGTPSVFVRSWGCDFSCEFCDTKQSWQEGSKWSQVSIEKIANEVIATRRKHVVLTGGNPFLQAGAFTYLIQVLGSSFHYTVETQASVFDELFISKCDLISMSPKLHDWRDGMLKKFVYAATFFQKESQVKIVVKDGDETLEALAKFAAIREYIDSIRWPLYITPRSPHFIIQPESSRGRSLQKEVMATLDTWYETTNENRVDIRLIPQTHRLALIVP